MTAAALAVQTGLAAVVGIVLAHEFGRGPETDGFFSAYVVFVVVVLAASAIRVTVLPAFGRARTAGNLGGEIVGFALVLASIALPLLVVAFVAASPIAAELTGEPAGLTQRTAAAALPWMMVAAVCQLFAGLSASALAALDDYGTSAFGFAAGSVVGLAFILLLVDSRGIDALAWGMALNGAIAFAVPTVALAVRARRESVPRTAVRPANVGYGPRIAVMGAGVALPLALQALYVITNRLAHGEGEGAQTSLGYAYLIVSAVIAVTASSLGLVTAVPLARVGLSAERIARHVGSSTWFALVAVGAVAGIFGVTGGSIAGAFLGSSYSADVGDELGTLVVALAPWAIVSVGVAVVFPLLFVADRVRPLPAIAIGVLVLQVPLAWLLAQLFGLDGLALSLAISTGAVLAALLVCLGAFTITTRALVPKVASLVAIACATFIPAGLLLPGAAAAVVGVVAYATVILLVRRTISLTAWRYLRALA
jgi:peptidoglycan biosynthesis protein MviN/MurJ (putative lipid II flippase)